MKFYDGDLSDYIERYKESKLYIKSIIIKKHLFYTLNEKIKLGISIELIEALLNNEVFFYPASYRRAYQFEETDNANILLRAEVLNKLNNKRNPIIITYSEALSEKVVSRKELKRQTINIKSRKSDQNGCVGGRRA